MNNKILDLVIPTWNNQEYLDQCIRSIRFTGVLGSLSRLIIVNNGSDPVEARYGKDPNILVLSPKDNLGWEGGLKLGLKHSKSPFVCFMNDDVFIPQADNLIFSRMLLHFANSKVAAVGPCTTVAAGCQNIYHPISPLMASNVSWLIFFCVMVRREALDEVGGIDDTLPGGDDFDLSIRLRKSGYSLVCDPSAFIIHHAFVTGSRVRGDSSQPGGWNSKQMTDDVNKALISKHGFKTWFKTIKSQIVSSAEDILPEEDVEGNIIRQQISNQKNIVELGCGGTKTIKSSVGVDRVKKGDIIPHLSNTKSIADVNCDVTGRLPFEDNSQDVVISRHILEHCLDPIKTLKEWVRIIKPGGKLIVAVPDESVTNGIPLNPEHVHAYDKDSLRSIMELIGLKHIKSIPSNNYSSFVGVYKK